MIVCPVLLDSIVLQVQLQLLVVLANIVLKVHLRIENVPCISTMSFQMERLNDHVFLVKQVIIATRLLQEF